MFGTRILALCVLFGSLPLTPVAGGQIPTSRPRTTQVPAPADSAPAAADPPARKEPPAAVQTPPKEVSPVATFPELQRQLADAQKQGQLGRALAVAERQRTLFPNELKATVDLANVLIARGDTARAEPLLRTAVTQKSVLYIGDSAALLGDAYASLGQLALDRGQSQEAIALLLRAVDNAPTAARARFLLARAFERSNDLARAGREIRAAFDVDAAAAQLVDYRLLARTATSGANARTAAEILGQGVDRFPTDSGMRLAYAGTLEAADDPAGALYQFLHLQLTLQPDNPAMKDVRAAIARLRSAAQDSAGDPDPELEGMFAYLDDADTGQHEAALPSIQDVVQLSGGSKGIPLLMLGRSLKATGRFGEAERVLSRVAEREPDNVPVLAELADLYFAEGRIEGATRLVDRARQVDAKNPRLVEVIAFWQ